jgi:hypothetical protein
VTGVNLSGSSVILKAARSVTDPVVLTKTNADGIQITGSGNSTISIPLDPEDTLNLSGKYYFEVEVTDTAGNISTVTVGRMTVNPALIS